MYGTRIVIADTDAVFRRNLKEAIRHIDYHVVGEATEARTLLQMIFQADPHVVVMDPNIPGSEGIGITEIIDEHRVAPVVAIVSPPRMEIGDLAHLPGVYGVLLKPLHVDVVQPVIETSLANFDRAMKLEKELKEVRQELQDRKIIERAKGLLMERKRMTERDAYRHLQRISMDKCISLVRVARELIGQYHQGE